MIIFMIEDIKKQIHLHWFLIMLKLENIEYMETYMKFQKPQPTDVEQTHEGAYQGRLEANE